MFTDFLKLRKSKKTFASTALKWISRNFYFSFFLNTRNLNSYDGWKISRTYDKLLRRKYTTLCFFSFLGIILMVLTNTLDWSGEYMSLIYLLPTTWKQSAWRYCQEKLLHVVKFTNLLNTMFCLFLLTDYYISISDKKWDQFYHQSKVSEARKQHARRTWKKILNIQGDQSNPTNQHDLIQKLIDEEASEISLASYQRDGNTSPKNTLNSNKSKKNSSPDDHCYSSNFFIRTIQIWGHRMYSTWDSTVKYKYFLEVGLLLPTPIPFLEKIPYCVHYADSIGLLMFLRLYQAMHLILIHSPMYKRRALMEKSTSKAVRFSTSFDWKMALKIFLYSNTVATVAVFVVLLATSLAFCVYVVERETTCTSCINHYYDAIYYTLISMTSMGYGDFVPASHMGKFLAALSGICGIAFIGLINFVFIQKLTPSASQKAVLDWLKYQRYSEEWLELGVTILQIKFLYKHKKCTDSYKTHMEKKLLKKIRKTKKKVIQLQVETGQEDEPQQTNEVDLLKKEVSEMKKILEKQNQLLELALRNNALRNYKNDDPNFDKDYSQAFEDPKPKNDPKDQNK